MDGIRGEVSNKIRSAIKAKLMELGAYVDDELPDYIMVMVANKRSRQQMEEDLQLFLGDSTSTFTNWLHTVLSKLQQVTVNSTEIKKSIDKKRPSSEESKKDKRKKLKKEKDKDKVEKDNKTPEKVKVHSKESEDNSCGLKDTSLKERPIKSEPADPIVIDAPPKDHAVQSDVQSSKSHSVTLHDKKSSESKGNDEEEDDDFINLKADVEVEMWGDHEESSGSALKTSSLDKRIPALSSSKSSFPEASAQESQTESSKSVTDKETSNSQSLKDITLSKTAAQEPKPAPRIIKISETIRQEQETLKPTSKVVKDPQTSNERSPPSPIIFSTNLSEKNEDDLEVFGRRVVQELRSMTLKQCETTKIRIMQVINEHQDLGARKIQNSNHKCSSSEPQPQDTFHTLKKTSAKSKTVGDRAREKRRRKRKSLELAAERARQTGRIKLNLTSNYAEGTLHSRKSRSPVRFGALRMDSPSLKRPSTSFTSGISKITLLRDPSPPQRTLESIVTTPVAASTSLNRKHKQF